ncbi:MAG: hypothetical protein U0165_08825 [Polyangiaceae bacterium]
MGASGSGKSTCMNVLGALDSPSSGSYKFRGVELTTLSLDQLALFRRHYVGFVFLKSAEFPAKEPPRSKTSSWYIEGCLPLSVESARYMRSRSGVLPTGAEHTSS